LHFQLDLPLASMVALMLVVLLRIEAFEHRGWSVAAGIVLGLGMLPKPSFAVYVLAPLVLAAARIRSRRAVTNLILALLIGGALSLPWYGPRAFSLVPEITSRSFRQAAESGHPDPLTAGALTLYPRWFPTQFGFVAALLVLLGLGVAARRRHWLLLAALLPALALLELLQNKNLRYTLPLLPVAAVLAGFGFGALPGRLKAGAGGLLLVAGVMQVSATAFGVPHISLPVVDVPFVVATPPVRDDWRQREILALLAQVFPVIGTFPLPDGSTATVRARRLDDGPTVAPAAMARAVESAIRARLSDVARDVEGLEIRLTHDNAIRLGRIARVELRAATATVGDLTRPNAARARVRDLQIGIDDLLVNPGSAYAERRLDPLDAGRVRIERATILAADFSAFLHQLKGLRNASVTLERDALALAVAQPGPDLTARVRLVPASDRPFAIAFERVRVGGVPLPGLLVDWVVRGYDPSLGLAS